MSFKHVLEQFLNVFHEFQESMEEGYESRGQNKGFWAHDLVSVKSGSIWIIADQFATQISARRILRKHP